ncbi:MAG: hypothetical protein ACLFR2_11220 [Candidatus Kapaibacterium sp.]
MIIYIDENMSPYLAQGLNILQIPLNHRQTETIQIRSVKEVFGEGAKDEAWIPEAGQESSCIITQDYNIHQIRHQKELCREYNLGMFYFRPPSKSGFSYWDMLVLMIKHWPDITRKAIEENKPFSYRITSRNARLESME